MFTGAVHLYPGQELKSFEVFRESEHRTASGRVMMNEMQLLGTIKAILAVANPNEITRWKQLEHPVTHKIIQQGIPAFEILPGDSIVYGDNRYIVRTLPYDPGGIHHWMIYYCQERRDV